MYCAVRGSALFDLYALPQADPSARLSLGHRLRGNDSLLSAVAQCAHVLSKDLVDTCGAPAIRHDSQVSLGRPNAAALPQSAGIGVGLATAGVVVASVAGSSGAASHFRTSGSALRIATSPA